MSDTNDTTQTVTLSRRFDVSAQRLFDAWSHSRANLSLDGAAQC